MFDYLIVVNDNGEMKTVTSLEIAFHSARLDGAMMEYLNKVLDYRSAKEALKDLTPDANVGSVAPDTET